MLKSDANLNQAQRAMEWSLMMVRLEERLALAEVAVQRARAEFENWKNEYGKPFDEKFSRMESTITEIRRDMRGSMTFTPPKEDEAVEA